MDNAASPTVVAAFSTVTATDPTRPLITYYDDATGERTELSGASLDNWVAKTANLLVDGLGLGSGDVAALALPPHWQTAAVLLGCWSAGLAVTLAPGTPAAVGFAALERLDEVSADDVYALSLAPFALPVPGGPPAGALDYAVEVRGHGDRFSGPPVHPAAAALVGPGACDHAGLVAAARARGAGIERGSRVRIDGDADPDPVAWLLAPLVAGASIVLCRHLDPDREPARLASEHAVAYPG